MHAQECSVALFSILLIRLNKFEFWHKIVYQELNDEQTCNLKFVICLTIFHQTATNLRLGLSTESFMNMWRTNKKASFWGRRPAYLSHKNVQVDEAKTGFVGWHTKHAYKVFIRLVLWSKLVCFWERKKSLVIKDMIRSKDCTMWTVKAIDHWQSE